MELTSVFPLVYSITRESSIKKEITNKGFTDKRFLFMWFGKKNTNRKYMIILINIFIDKTINFVSAVIYIEYDVVKY